MARASALDTPRLTRGFSSIGPRTGKKRSGDQLGPILTQSDQLNPLNQLNQLNQLGQLIQLSRMGQLSQMKVLITWIFNCLISSKQLRH